jgi:hypothetical protein
MFFVNCSRCGPHIAVSDYTEDGVCGPCLLTEITEELGLYERIIDGKLENARHENNG